MSDIEWERKKKERDRRRKWIYMYTKPKNEKTVRVIERSAPSVRPIRIYMQVGTDLGRYYLRRPLGFELDMLGEIYIVSCHDIKVYGTGGSIEDAMRDAATKVGNMLENYGRLPYEVSQHLDFRKKEEEK